MHFSVKSIVISKEPKELNHHCCSTPEELVYAVLCLSDKSGVPGSYTICNCFFFFMRMKAVGKLSDGEFPNTSVENSQVSEIRAIPPGV